jgi:hypothetical protein
VITITLCPQKPTAKQAVTGVAIPDRATTVWGGRPFEARSAHGASMALARELVAAGCQDQPWEARTPGGERTVYGNSLYALARTTIEESSGGPRFRRFVERPDFAVGKEQEAGQTPSGSYECGELVKAAGTPTARNQRGAP